MKTPRSGLYVHDIENPFRVNDAVIDVTAEKNNWPDVKGVVTRVDGSHVEVRYENGNVRAKMYVNLRKNVE